MILSFRANFTLLASLLCCLVAPLPAQSSTLALSTSSNSVQLGQAVTLTAAVTPATAAGIITFYDGVNVLGTSNLLGGVATLVTRALPSGNQSLRAVFAGDGTNAAATSENVAVAVTAVHGFGLASPVTAGAGFKVAAADYNGDGITDFAIQDIAHAGFTVLLGRGDGTFQNAGTFGTLYLPTAQANLVAADFNSDGKMDIAGAANSTGGIVIFPGNGDGTFGAPVTYVNNNIYPNSLTAGDFNGDGKADLAISNGGADSGIGIYLGNGDGTFKPIVTYAAGNSPASITVADFNGDNRQDVLVVNVQSASVSVLLGNGDGTFQAAKSYTTGSQPLGVVVADFNGDGRTDLATANSKDNTVSILLGNGDGTFQPAASYGVGSNPWSVGVGDFNGDGKLDLLAGNVADFASTSISVLLGNGDGTFRPARGFATNGVPYSFVVGDFNGDGRADVAVGASLGFAIQAGAGAPDLTIAGSHTSNFASSQTAAQYTVTVGNLGAGWSDDLVTVTDTLPPVMTATAISGNGWLCTLASVSCTRSDALPPGATYPTITVTVRIGAVPPQSVTNTVSIAAAAGDPNPSNNTAGDPTIIGLAQTITFQPIPDHSLGDAPFIIEATSSSGLSVGFSVDATATSKCSVAGVLVTLKNFGTCSITATQPGDATYGPADSVTRTFKISGGVSSVVLSSSSQGPVLLGTPVTLTATVSPSTSTFPITFYDGAAILGIASPSSGSATLTTPLLGTGSHKLRAWSSGASSNTVGLTVTSLAGSFPAYNQPQTVGISWALALGDVNGDGAPDIAVADTFSGAVGILLGDGRGNFAKAVDYPAGGTPSSIAFADFNGDGRLDVVVGNSLGAGVLLGRGDGTFQSPTLIVIGGQAGTQGYSVAVSDFDGDGKADLVVALAKSSVAVMLGNGDGTFKSPVTYAINAQAYTQSSIAVAVDDFNGDGIPDLAVTDAGNFAVSILLGNGDGTFQPSASYAAGGAPQSIALGDLNGDGLTDVVVGFNGAVGVLLGNGTGGLMAPRTQTSTAGKDYVAISDFNGDGKPDVAAASGLNATVTILPGNGDGTLQTGTDVLVFGTPTSLIVADLNGDHKPDMITGLANNNTLTVTLSAAVPAQLIFTGEPATANIGIAAPAVLVQVSDRFGNLVSGSTAAVTLTSSPSGVTSTVNAVNGVAAFRNLVFAIPGTYTLTATTSGVPQAVSNSFNVVTVLPAVVIDSPAPEAQLAAGDVTISGWAIDNLNSIGTAISNVRVLVDGAAAGNAIYGISRPDVCSAYPGRAGCPNVGFSATVRLLAGTHTITVVATDSDATPNSGSSSVTVTTTVITTRVGVFRNGVSFLEDTNGNGGYDAGIDRFIPGFTGPGGFVAGDVPVVGDWNGDAHAEVGIYRTATGQWFLDANNNGVYDAGDLTYGFGGLAGDMPFVGDWTGSGKSCIGIYRSSGSVWLLDLNCNGVFENTPTDAFFPFGGLAGDVPVVGAWTGGTTRVGVVRKYAPGGVPQGEPFFWVLDAGAANAGNLPADHPAATNAFAFGGLAGDVFVTGDWSGIGTSKAGVYRGGLWVLDAALPSAPQVAHVPGLTFGYGGLAGDVPVTGKW